MSKLTSFHLCLFCTDPLEGRFNCNVKVEKCVCDPILKNAVPCDCCKICKEIISYPTTMSICQLMDTQDLTRCKKCDHPLLHVHRDGNLACFSMQSIHTKLRDPNAFVKMDRVNIFTTNRRGFN